MKYDKTPLDQVAADLQIKLAIPVQLDRKAIEDVGESIAKPVTFSSSGVSAKATVALLLREFSFAAVIHDEVLLITSQEEAENIEETRVYDVADLVGVGDEKDFDTLIDAISGCVSPNTWPVGTGPGPIAPLTVSGTDLIVLSQTADVQRSDREPIGRLTGCPPWSSGERSEIAKTASAVRNVALRR